MNMDDDETVASAVRGGGEPISDESRASLRARFESAMRGDIDVIDEPARRSSRRWIVAVAASVALVAGVTALIARSIHPTGRPPISSSPTLVPATTTTAVSATAPSNTTAPSTQASTLPASTTEPTTSMPASTTGVSTTTTLPSLGGLPYASIDATLPRLVDGSTVSFPTSGSASDWATPWPDLPFGSDTSPTPQGWLLATRTTTSGPWTVTFLDATRTKVRWRITVADRKADGSMWNRRLIAGPSNVVYVHYFGTDRSSVDAIAVSGPTLGKVVASWPLPTPVGECGFPCQYDTPPTELTTDGGTKVPFVDEKGRTITTPNPYFGVSFAYTYAPGPAMPTSWVTHSDGSPYDDLVSVRVTVTRRGTTWRFDALGVQTYAGGTEGFPFFQYAPTLDGGLVLTFRVGDHPDPAAGRHATIAAVLHGDGSVTMFRLDTIDASTSEVMVDAAGDLVTSRNPLSGGGWHTWVTLRATG